MTPYITYDEELGNILALPVAMVIPKKAAEYAIKIGFFAIGEKSDNTILLNPPDFHPKAW